jgi:nucleolar protein 12
VEFVKKNKLQDDDSKAQDVKKRKKPKHKHRDKDAVVESSTRVDSTDSVCNEKEQRTCFVGNISTTDNKKSVTKFFKECGEIESLRFRSVPVEGTAVGEDGNQNLVKKVCSNKLKFGDQKGSFNAYVVFKTSSAAALAVSTMNNRLLSGRHLRVDHCVPTVLDPRSTVFLGSLPFYTDEEELRVHFAKVRYFFSPFWLLYSNRRFSFVGPVRWSRRH